jgi:predicted Zn-dependent protease
MSRAFFALLLAAALAAPAAAEPAPVVAALDQELARAMKRLRLKGYEAPYFVAYTVRDVESYEVMGRFGAVTGRSASRDRSAHVAVRVGDYRFDNTSSSDRDMFDLSDGDRFEPSSDAPLDDDPDALRAVLWLLSDARYKEALAAYARKRGRRATRMVEDEDLPSFSREKPARHLEPAQTVHWDDAQLAERVRRLGARFKAVPDLLEGQVRFTADRVVRYYVNSEGTQVVADRVIYSAQLQAAGRAKDGQLLSHEKFFYGRSPEDLPGEDKLSATLDQLVAELTALRKAPVIDPYTGPALLMEEAAGVFFHETVGHRLEGERQNDDKEGRTFKGQVGKRVLPEFLSVIDDPTARAAGGLPLNGYYTYDDEGVAARPVTLIRRGVLRDYLKSRTPISGSLASNGHGRAEGTNDPMGRMANLFVRSDKRVSVAQLKQLLIEEVRRQGKPFGLIIRDISGGSTNTTNYGYQAFKGHPRLVYRVDAKSGEETLVRGVEMVGTPLTTVSKILATSDTEGVFNGFCGAESGFVPVSTIAPAVLMSEIELQRAQKTAERPTVLPAPWADPPPRRP